MAQSNLENQNPVEPSAAQQELACAFDLPGAGFGDATLNPPVPAETSDAGPVNTADQRHLKPRTVDALVKLLKSNAGYRDRARVLGAGIFIASVTIIAQLGFIASGEFGWALACMLVLLVEGGVMWQADRLEQVNTALEHSYLTHMQVGALYDALDWPDSRIRNIASMLLSQAIPHVQECDSDVLTAKRKFSLYRCLAESRAHRNPALTIAILRGLAVFGTDSAIPYVERLADSWAFTVSGRQIRHEAREVLPLLEKKAAVERAAEEARIAAEAPPVVSPVRPTGAVEQLQSTEMSVLVDEQMQALDAELRNIRQPGMRIGFLVASWLGIAPYTVLQSIEQFSHHNWPLGLLFGGLTIGTTQLHRITLTGQHRALASRLAKMDDVKYIGRLCELLDWPDKSMHGIAMKALTPLLRRVKASDNVLHTPAQRAILYRSLKLSNAWRQFDFMISILKALEQIGDVAAVPYVLDLVNSVPANDRERRVCDAAHACLPYIQHRAKLSESSHMLLRASSAADVGTDSLVRAAGPTAESDPEQLLRAHGGNGNA